MKVLNLIKEFKRLQMKEFESIKEYSDKLIEIANKVRVLRTNLSDSRLVQKILVSVLEKYEATITSFEKTKDLTQLRVVELISALLAQEQRRLMRCWRRPDVKCRRCNLIGHIESWLVDSGCTNHMTYDEKLFKDLDRSLKSKVRIGNGEYLEVKGRGTVTIESCTGTKLILDVLFVPEIDQNLLSVGQLVEKRFKVMFEEGMCLILDSSGNELFWIKMQKKSFSLNPFEKEQVASKCQEGMTSMQQTIMKLMA
ncbi:uncharacterized protein [Gossypium hirsutum]|uniref:Retrovirus-related Pol polyprotein from transposon TNT 1-94-like beta-barrel domain-containing protein n=1 Tax=Gossypium hirsutum TaxID=3635 RepID=A0A1U8HMJ5_GOSHI|nr:uncharacterized protein LOC107887515 [Gossypium hirsutum]